MLFFYLMGSFVGFAMFIYVAKQIKYYPKKYRIADAIMVILFSWFSVFYLVATIFRPYMPSRFIQILAIFAPTRLLVKKMPLQFSFCKWFEKK